MNACVLYEMLVFAPCSSYHCTFLLICHAADPWEPGNRDHPTILCMFRTSAHSVFCTGISMSYQNRYVAVASFSDMLPWHHFCFAAVAPFSFCHGDKCSLSCSCQHFHKNCIKLAYVIRIMIITIKMFKIVVCFNC